MNFGVRSPLSVYYGSLASFIGVMLVGYSMGYEKGYETPQRSKGVSTWTGTPTTWPPEGHQGDKP